MYGCCLDGFRYYSVLALLWDEDHYPRLFLPICFILPAFMAVCAGTSWGSISTIGVVLCGMAEGLGIPVAMAAGAVISGAFFGDKMSPLSDTTLLAASSCEVPLLPTLNPCGTQLFREPLSVL